MNDNAKCRVISAVEMASVSNISNLTNDRIEALAGGHGMVNMAIHTVANVITDELLKGEKLSIEFADARRLPIDDIEKAVGSPKIAPMGQRGASQPSCAWQALRPRWAFRRATGSWSHGPHAGRRGPQRHWRPSVIR
ncbi:MAG: hypothetical protein ACLS76_07590 [Eubacterium callanderi]